MPALKLVIGVFRQRRTSLWLGFLVFSLFVAVQPAQAIEINFKIPTGSDWDAGKNSDFAFNNLIKSGVCALSQASGCVVTVVENGELKTRVVENKSGQASGTGGALVALAGLTSVMYQAPPTSSREYLADLGSNIGITKPAYAQQNVVGSGEGIVRPILKIWKVSRNISYLFFILVFIVVGLMIMFRQRISPQAVITVQAALPSLVIGLILVTFSYFIASLLIDTSFLGVRLVGYMFSEPISGLSNQLGNPVQLAQNSNIFDLFNSSSATILPSLPDLLAGNTALSDVFKGAQGVQQAAPIAGIGIPIIIGAMVGLLAGPLGALVGGAIGLGVGLTGAATPVTSIAITGLVGLVLLIALFVQLFRLFFGLVNSYIQILVYTLGGPILILFGSLPGRGEIISLWIRTILANALVFPVVFFVILLAGAILANTSQDVWRVSPPLFGNLPADLLRLVIAYGLILGTPSLPGMVRDALGVKPPEVFAQAALGGAFAGASIGRATAARFVQPLQTRRQAFREAVFRWRYGGGVGPSPYDAEDNPLVRIFQPR